MTTKSTARDQMKKSFSRKLMAARLSAKMSQLRLAEMSGISNSTISNYEVGKTLPDEANMKKIMKCLPALAGKKEVPSKPGLAKIKTSVIESATVDTNQARLAFMKSLVHAAPEVKSLLAQADKAQITPKETFDMLNVLLER